MTPPLPVTHLTPSRSPGFIDIQINGGYGFDFSVCEGDDQKYRDGLKLVAERIIETGVTALVPTIIVRENISQ